MAAPQVVVMGVSGCGKSTVGGLLAAQLGLRFVEGDALHPPANVARMTAGIRAHRRRPPGLAAGGGWPAGGGRGAWPGRGGQLLGAQAPLPGSAAGRRAAAAPGAPARRCGTAGRAAGWPAGHYMPASLLPSQLATLQPPGPDEDALVLHITLPPAQLAARAAAWLLAGPPALPAGPRAGAPSAPGPA